ncbi:zinc finger protein 808-like, partial [Penaeus chinensis]|uniref:zinc finger protein 808-like n=1 Tax=Penaeus chinensis TaxID=139456 RepID=UPI001FB5A0D1
MSYIFPHSSATNDALDKDDNEFPRIHETNAKDSCDLVQDCNDLLLRDAFVAEDCGNKFSSDGDQAMHKESLEEELQHKVEALNVSYVSHAFSQKGNLVRHMRVHKKEYCELFNKVISDKSNLLRHIRVHTKETSYSCDICDKIFSRKAHL